MRGWADRVRYGAVSADPSGGSQAHSTSSAQEVRGGGHSHITACLRLCLDRPSSATLSFSCCVTMPTRIHMYPLAVYYMIVRVWPG